MLLFYIWNINNWFISENTKQVKFTVYVDKQTAGSLNSGDDTMEDILVLHLEGGKDFFVSFSK